MEKDTKEPLRSWVAGNGPIYFGMAVGAVLGLVAYVKGWV